VEGGSDGGSTTTTPTDNGNNPVQCFAADSIVTRLSSTHTTVRVPLSSLRVGDRVLSMDEEGQPTFEPVLYLSHKLSNKDRTHMLQISYVDAKEESHTTEPLVVSGDHLLFVYRKDTAEDDPPSLSLLSGTLVAAESVRVGDRIGVAHCPDDTAPVCSAPTLIWRSVRSVESVEVIGLQNAWTASGRIVVSDVLSSPFRLSTFATYRRVLAFSASLLRPFGVSEVTAHVIGHEVYAVYLSHFRQPKPHQLSDAAYTAGLLLVALGAVKAARKVVE
jgi:hypothetical protein